MQSRLLSFSLSRVVFVLRTLAMYVLELVRYGLWVVPVDATKLEREFYRLADILCISDGISHIHSIHNVRARSTSLEIGQ